MVADSGAGGILRWLQPPSRTVPMTSWRAPSKWRGGPTTLIVLALGLYLFGTGEALLVEATLGVSPWTVLAEGISSKTGWGVGVSTLAISIVVLLGWIPLREKPGLGTVANAIIIATALGVGVLFIPSPDSLAVRLLMVLAGIAVVGIGSGMYLTVGMGPGPRDGLMTGIHHRTGQPVSLVRAGIELVALGIGWLLGGTVGVGTVLWAFLIGPAVGYGLSLVLAISRRIERTS